MWENPKGKLLSLNLIWKDSLQSLYPHHFKTALKIPIIFCLPINLEVKLWASSNANINLVTQLDKKQQQLKTSLVCVILPCNFLIPEKGAKSLSHHLMKRRPKWNMMGAENSIRLIYKHPQNNFFSYRVRILSLPGFGSISEDLRGVNKGSDRKQKEA